METPGSDALTTETEKNKRVMNDFTTKNESTEKEISHGRMLWQGCSRSLYQGPLASSSG
jgi:hypothetical protein